MLVAHIGHNDDDEIVVNFEPDQLYAWHVVFTLDEAEAFAQTLMRRVQQVREEIAVRAEGEGVGHASRGE